MRYKHAPERVFLILERHIFLLLLKCLVSSSGGGRQMVSTSAPAT
jgi:hypothetical protein